MNVKVRRMPLRAVSTTTAALVALLTAAPATLDGRAQSQYDPYEQTAPVAVDDRDWSDEIPAHIAAIDGRVLLERDGRIEDAEENVILLAGDRLRTDRGRAEVLFAEGSALALDEATTIDLLDDSLLRLVDGRVRLAIVRGVDRLDYRIDTPAGSALINAAGEYKLSLSTRRSEPELQLAVLRGSAELANERGRTLVRAGTFSSTTASYAPSLPYTFNAAAYDALDRWADAQSRARVGYASTRYLPEEVHYYAGAFDTYGDWNYEPTYGYVWYPRVDVGWRPYHHGRWSFYGRFGWTWIGAGRWSWPTHHYGRWGHSGSRWFWIPQRRWAPAWVAWASAPGYVGWCPLGFDNRPVISITHISIGSRDRWHGWSVVPDRPFRGGGVAVSRYAVADDAFRGSVGRFAVRSAPAAPDQYSRQAPLRGPVGRSLAVSRGAAAGGSRDFGARGDARAPDVRSSVGRDTSPAPSSRRTVTPGARVQPSPGSASSRRVAPPSRGNDGSRATVPGTRSSAPSRVTPPSRPDPDPSPRGSAVRRGGDSAYAPPATTPPPARTYEAGRSRYPDARSSAAPSRVSPSRAAPPSREAPAARRVAPPRSAPDRPSGSERGSAASRRSGGAVGGGSSAPAAPSARRGPDRSSSAPSGPSPRAGDGGGSRRQAPPSSSSGGRAVRRPGGGGQ